MDAAVKKCHHCYNVIDKAATVCPICHRSVEILMVAKEQKTFRWGVWLTVLIIVVVAAGAVLAVVRSGRQKGGATAGPAQTAAPRLLSMLNDKQKMLDAYRVELAEAKTIPDMLFDVRLNPKGDSDTLELFVQDSWRSRTKEARLQAARNMQRGWARYYSPDEPDRAYIKLLDMKGGVVGGSDPTAGSVVTVAD